jgi:hypothetical protein
VYEAEFHARFSDVRSPPLPMRSSLRGERGFDPAVEQGKTELSYRLWCGCSYRVCCEIVSYGEGLAVLVFFDDEEKSATHGEQVWRCPGCHDSLGLLSFLS